MKKGILYRAIVLVLICTMLLGLTGFTVTGSDTAGADAQTEGEVVTPGEGTGEDPAATPEPSENPEPEPGEEPEPDKCLITIEQPSGGTITCMDPEFPADGIVEKGTELHFAVKEATADVIKSVFCDAYVNGEAVETTDGVFSVTVEVDTIISAEFLGIKSVEVSDNDKWKTSKSVVVKTFGDVANVALMETDAAADAKPVAERIGNSTGEYVFTFGNAGEIQKEIGVLEAGKTNYKVVVTKKAQNDAEPETIEVPVAVSMIDYTKPEILCSKKDAHYGKEYTIDVTDDGCGLNYVEVSYRGFGGKWVKDLVNSQEDLKGTAKSTIRFTALSSREYKIVASDLSGNINKWTVDDDSGPVITGKTISKGLIENETIWAGKDAKLTVTAQDASGVAKITLKDPQGKETEITRKELKEEEIQQETVWIADFDISQSGEYTIIAEDDKENKTNESITIEYDPDAPKIENQAFSEDYTGENFLKGVIHFISGGLLFNDGFRISFDVNDKPESSAEETSVSEAYQYAWLLVAEDESAPTEAPSFVEETAGWNYGIAEAEGNRILITNDKKNFTGSIYLCVWDKAGNASMGKFTVVNDEGTFETVTNIATTNDNDDIPTLTVMAKTPVADEEGNIQYKAYSVNAEAKDTEGWVKSVEFEILGAPALPQDEESDETKTTYKYATEVPAVTVTATYGNNNLTVNDLTVSPDPENVQRFRCTCTAVLGDEDVSYEGKVEFTISYPVIKTTVTTVDGVQSSENVEIEIEASVSVFVRVQNYLKAATVQVNRSDAQEVNGWYNGVDNVLESLCINGCADSTAPAWTYYKLSYTNAAQDTKSAKVVSSVTKQDSAIKSANKKANSSDIVKLIEETGYYTLTVWSEDAAGNQTDEVTYTFSHDSVAPEISANFTETADDFSPYYRKQRKVTINVTDDAFTGEEDAEKMFRVDFQVEAGTAAPSISEKWQYTGNGVWQIVYTCGDVVENSGLYGDDYTVTVTAKDNAGNTASTDASGQLTQNGTLQNATVVYDGVDVHDFNLDQTKPIVSVSFDNNSARNGKYFAAGRTATITVEDHNFDPARVTLDTTGASGQSEWTSNGDVHTKTVSYQNDANCKFSIEVVDKAGNKTVNTEVAYTGVATGEFVIDKTAPILNITGTDATPYPDACTPGISGSDTNMSSEYTLQLTRTVRASRNEDVTALLDRGNVAVSATDINAVFANIPDDAANDGIYVLTASVTDMAGNSTQTTSTFTVNRHGSFYVFNDALSDVVNAKYVEKADGSYTVTEYNASPLVAGSVKIEIYRDGELVKTLTPNVATAAIGASGLYEYVYDLPAENFAQDGRYRVAVSSRDEANNESDSTKLEESLLEFTVDSVPPEITMIKGLEKAIVNADKLDVELSAIDTYGIASVKIVVDGKVVKEFVTQDTYDALMKSGKTLDHEYAVLGDTLNFTDYFTLAQSKDTQNVEIIVTDMAGNMTTTKDDSFEPVYKFNSGVLISTNFFVRFIHNPVAIIGTVLVIAVIAGAIWYIVAGKKKRAQKAAA